VTRRRDKGGKGKNIAVENPGTEKEKDNNLFRGEEPRGNISKNVLFHKEIGGTESRKEVKGKRQPLEIREGLPSAEKERTPMTAAT